MPITSTAATGGYGPAGTGDFGRSSTESSRPDPGHDSPSAVVSPSAAGSSAIGGFGSPRTICAQTAGGGPSAAERGLLTRVCDESDMVVLPMPVDNPAAWHHSLDPSLTAIWAFQVTP